MYIMWARSQYSTNDGSTDPAVANTIEKALSALA